MYDLSNVKRGEIVGAHPDRASVSRTANLVAVSRTTLSRVIATYTNLECPRSACLPFFPEKGEEDVSSVSTCNVKAKKEKVTEDRWVSQLIPLLPMEIAEIVAKEPLEKSDDYPHIKNLLLARFQLTPIALRDRFESHQRRPGAMWADLVFELRSYLDNWLPGMKVDDFAALKELLVTEQIKKSTK
ncbi:uncharacterized protein TNCV_1750011 [Trichonephila clavipes]|nr:uncharacterized protein TNCV_1750011 [Trichonephila clavipes]